MPPSLPEKASVGVSHESQPVEVQPNTIIGNSLDNEVAKVSLPSNEFLNLVSRTLEEAKATANATHMAGDVQIEGEALFSSNESPVPDSSLDMTLADYLDDIIISLSSSLASQKMSSQAACAKKKKKKKSRQRVKIWNENL